MSGHEGSSGSHRLFELCRSLPGVTEDVKWGSDLVFSVGGKMFACFELPEGQPLSLKVDPATCEMLLEHPGIEPAPYLAKHNWVRLDTAKVLPAAAIEDLIETSHALVAAKLSKKRRAELGIRERDEESVQEGP